METNLLDSFFALFEANKRIYWLYILSSLGIASLYLYVYKNERVKNLSKTLWLHPSAMLDYKYFILSFFIKTLCIIPLVIAVNEVSLFVYEYLLDSYGFVKIHSLSYTQIMFLFTLTLFVVSDFTRYWLHRLLHSVPFLWEFHKVHHSAQVLTPITFYRVHPVENLLFGFRYALSIGLVTGIFVYLFGAMISIYEVLGVNILLFIFSLAGSNLRHSHIQLAYPSIIEKIFISPFAHQLHHSTKYYNKNYGGYLAIWDTMFHSHQATQKVHKDTLEYGIYKEQFQTLFAIVCTPFLQLIRRTPHAH